MCISRFFLFYVNLDLDVLDQGQDTEFQWVTARFKENCTSWLKLIV